MRIDPDVAASFLPVGLSRFTCKNMGTISSCPTYTIARLARSASMLPEGFTPETWDRIAWEHGWYGTELAVSGRQAHELASIGRQLLELAGKGELELSYFERQSIEHLLSVVGE